MFSQLSCVVSNEFTMITRKRYSLFCPLFPPSAINFYPLEFTIIRENTFFWIVLFYGHDFSFFFLGFYFFLYQIRHIRFDFKTFVIGKFLLFQCLFSCDFCNLTDFNIPVKYNTISRYIRYIYLVHFHLCETKSQNQNLRIFLRNIFFLLATPPYFPFLLIIDHSSQMTQSLKWLIWKRHDDSRMAIFGRTGLWIIC